jgi:hypothetical protein
VTFPLIHGVRNQHFTMPHSDPLPRHNVGWRTLRRCRLREGKGGGDREVSGPVRRGWPEGMGGARRCSVVRRRRAQLLREEEAEGGFWFFTFSEARDVNLEGANTEVACWARWAKKGREEVGRGWAGNEERRRLG